MWRLRGNGSMVKKLNVNQDKINNKINKHYSLINIREQGNDDINYSIQKKDKCIGKYIDKFENVIKEKIPEESLKNFYYNINNLKVKKCGFKIIRLLNKKRHLQGQYSMLKNEIRINKKIDIEKVVYHELFHLASSSKTRDKNLVIINCGFSTIVLDFIKNRGTTKGEALTEGYTELLAQRYFDNNNILRKFEIYAFENKITESLEEIIGENNMSKYYLNSDCASLIEDLSKYSSKEDTIKFIDETDDLFQYEEQGTRKDISKAINSYKYIIKYLTDTYKNKLDSDISNGIITREEANNVLEDIIVSYQEDLI